MTTYKHQAIDIELALLGAIISDSANLDRCMLREDHFFREEHKVIFTTIRKMEAEGKPIDVYSVNGATSYEYATVIAEAMDKYTSKAHIEYHSAIVYEKYVERTSLDMCRKAIAEISEGENDVFARIQKLSVGLENLNLSAGKEFEPLKSLSKQVIESSEKIQESGAGITGLDTGLTELNRITYGLQKTDLTIIAARPGMGKTALALTIAINVAKTGVPVAFFSLEMGAVQLAGRAVASLSGINSRIINRGQLNADGWVRVLDAKYDIPLYIDDTPGLTVIDFKAKARRAKKAMNVGLVIVDYLQLMRVLGIKGNREQEIGEISRALKLIAKELGLPVIALAQLSRDIEKRGGNSQPKLSDLRESGQIEQDADNVWFPWADPEDNEDMDTLTPTVKIIVAKHRNGPVGFVRTVFDKTIQKYVDLI